MSIKSSLAKREKLNIEEFDIFINCNYDKVSFLVLNQIEKEIVELHGQKFISDSSDKIQYIIGFLINKHVDGLYRMYSESFDIYTSQFKNDDQQKQTFNVVFIVLIHIALKILAKNLDEGE